MQTPVKTRSEGHRHIAGHALGNNERQLLARIRQLEAIALPSRCEQLRYLSNSLCAIDDYVASFFARKHNSRVGTTWFGVEVRLDALGRKWTRSYEAVVDDFGNLVEVQS